MKYDPTDDRDDRDAEIDDRFGEPERNGTKEFFGRVVQAVTTFQTRGRKPMEAVLLSIDPLRKQPCPDCADADSPRMCQGGVHHDVPRWTEAEIDRARVDAERLYGILNVSPDRTSDQASDDGCKEDCQ